MDLKVKVEEMKKGCIFIELAGDMDAYTSREFKEVVRDLIKRRKYHLIVDIEQVTCIDSVGVGELLGALKKTREKGGDLWLVYNKSKAKRFLEITGLNGNFAVFKSRSRVYGKLKVS